MSAASGNGRALEWAFRVIQVVVLPLLYWLSAEVHAQGKSLARIEGNRFTNSDGSALQEQIAALRTRIATLPQETPPAWFLNEFRRLEEKVDYLATTLEAHNRNHP